MGKSTVLAIAGILLILTSQTHQQCLSEDDGRTPGKEFKSRLYKGQQIFTVNFLDALNKAMPNENLFFSPYSLYHALLLAYFGSKNQTQQGLENALQLVWAQNKAEVMNAYHAEKRNRERIAKESPVEFTSVDRLYFSKEVELEDCIKDLFHEELNIVDFKNEPEKCLNEINQFVEDVTKGNIKNLLSKGDITSNTKITLANAAYFKGSWASKFNRDNTKKEIFYSSPSKMSFVEMMSKNASYNHATNEYLGCHVLEIPYQRSDNVDIGMIVFLPPTVPNGLENVLSKLTPDSLHRALQEGFPRDVQLKFPKFSSEKTVELMPVLQKMNVGDLFEPTANLAGFSTKTALNLDDGIHKARIEVDEEGSTAAAATALFSFRSSRPVEPAQFFCDHPFLYLIYDHNTKAILFAGVYRGPE